MIQAGIDTTNFPELLLQLSRLQQSSVPDGGLAEQDIQATRESFAVEIEKLSEILSAQRVTAVDGDVIDMVGMLFEMIVNDETLTDAVKALLSHLDTPLLADRVAG